MALSLPKLLWVWRWNLHDWKTSNVNYRTNHCWGSSWTVCLLVEKARR